MTTNTLPSPDRFQVERAGTSIPAAAWWPTSAPKGVIVACHGGSGHKECPAIVAIARECLPRGIAVLAIDGPVHGERRMDGNLDPAAARQSFRDAWRAGVGQTSMADDMRAALDALVDRRGTDALPTGYVGVSMGTAYGLPFLASEPRIRAAAIGLWGITYVASGHLADHASRVKCPVWFTQQWNDEFFDREGTFGLFDAIGADDKRLVAYPGGHRELEGERLQDAIDFVAARLTSG